MKKIESTLLAIFFIIAKIAFSQTAPPPTIVEQAI
jgi:hypothetical protein